MAVMPERNVMEVQRQDHYASVGTAASYLLRNIKLSSTMFQTQGVNI